MNPPKISIVIGTRNRDENLRIVLQALQSQTINKTLFEIIIVNYGGNSNTKNLLQRFPLLNIRYYYVAENGIYNESRAKNIGIKKSVGEMVICMNSDIILPPKLLESFYHYYSSCKTNQLYQISRYDLEEKINIDNFFQNLKIDNTKKYELHGQDNTACGDFQATLKSNWLRVHGYNEHMTGWGGMDLDLVDRMAVVNTSQIWLPKDVFKIYHLYHPAKAPSRAKVNLTLKQLIKTTNLSNRWGVTKKKIRIAILINDVDPFRLSGILKINRTLFNNPQIYFVLNLKKFLYKPQDRNLNEKKISLITTDHKDFFYLAYQQVKEKDVDIIVELDHYSLLSRLDLPKIILIHENYDLNVDSEIKYKSKVQSISKLILPEHRFFSIRTYNRRIGDILEATFSTPLNYLRSPFIIDYCRRLEVEINIGQKKVAKEQKIDSTLFLQDISTISPLLKPTLTVLINIYSRIYSLLFSKKYLYLFDKQKLNKVSKIIIGSGGNTQAGFLSTDIDNLDIRKASDWSRYFYPNTLRIILAEHVFEHLNNNELEIALRNINNFLIPGGRLRLAIPDAFRTDQVYLNDVKPPSDGHKSYHNIDSISDLLVKSGFKVIPLEYFDKEGEFHYHHWSPKYGIIYRSVRFDKQVKYKIGSLMYTSLIVDAIKN